MAPPNPAEPPVVPPTEPGTPVVPGDTLTVPPPETPEAEPRNRMMAENQIDLDALSETGPEATGNRYPFSAKAATNFARDERQQANRLVERAMDHIRQADHWMDVASEARDAEERTVEEQKRYEDEKRRADQKMDELLSQLQRLADKMDNQE